MLVWEYSSYEEYKAAQLRANLKKLDRVWVKEDSLNYLSKRLYVKLGSISFGLCHGTRNGFEQRILASNLDAEILGTEIAPTATQFPNTIEWDFHEVKPEWLGAVDFVYSNALDHSYDPKKCLNQWVSCLKPDGYCVLHWSVGHIRSKDSEPFGATLGEYVDLVMENHYLEEVIQYDPKTTQKFQGNQYFLFIKAK